MRDSKIRPNLRSTCTLPTGVVLTLLLALSWGLLCGAPAAAQLQPPAYQGFELNGDFLLMVSGEKVPKAEIYSTRTPPALLILTPALPAPVMVIPGSRRVETINVMKLAKRPNGSLDVLPQATLKPQGSFQLDDQDLVFMVDDTRVRLVPKPPLLGLHPASDLKEYSPLYVKRAEAYKPDPTTLEQLEQEPKPVEVRVFFGSWCPTCQRMVPNAVRVAEELAGSKVRFQFYGLPHGFSGEPEATKYGITGVPTAIVFVDGQEAGRIEGTRWLQPEVAIRDILKGSS